MIRTIAWKLGDAAPRLRHGGGIYDARLGGELGPRPRPVQETTPRSTCLAAPPAIERGLAFVPALSGLSCPYWDRNVPPA